MISEIAMVEVYRKYYNLSRQQKTDVKLNCFYEIKFYFIEEMCSPSIGQSIDKLFEMKWTAASLRKIRVSLTIPRVRENSLIIVTQKKKECYLPAQSPEINRAEWEAGKS